MERLAQKFHHELSFQGIRKRSSSVPPPKSLKAVVLGKDGVGKTAFTVRLLTKRFIGEYDSTLEKSYHHRIDVDGQCIMLDIFDTAGENSVDKMDSCCKADIFYVLYSATDRPSFREAHLITNYLLSKKIPTSKINLIATKIDLKHFIHVSEFEGKMLALDMGLTFHQISNAEGFSSTREVLFDSIRLAVNKQPCPQRAKSVAMHIEGARTQKNLHKPLSRLRSKSF